MARVIRQDIMEYLEYKISQKLGKSIYIRDISSESFDSGLYLWSVDNTDIFFMLQVFGYDF